MKKISLLLMVLLLIGATTQSFAQDSYPFKPLTSTIANYIQTVKKTPKYQNDRTYFRTYRNKRDSLCEAQLGKTIHVEIKPGLGFELSSKTGQIGKARYMMGSFDVPINVDIKVKDANLAFKNSNLHVLVYDNKGIVVYVGSLEKEQSLTSYTPKDELVVVSDDGPVKNPYTNGDILHKGFEMHFDTFTAYRFINVSKIVIAKPDYNLSDRVRKENNTIVQNNKKTFKGSY